jgi:hypothetical protein
MPSEPAPDLRALADKFRASLSEQERRAMATQVRSISDEKYAGQPPPAVGVPKEGPSGIAERYRALSQNESGKGSPPGEVIRATPSSSAELGELKAPESPVQKLQKGGRER